jgi:hypothetical protein
MEVVITHLGNMSQLIPATSVINGIKKYKENINITWVVADDKLCCLNKYNKINRTIPLEQFIKERKFYDLLINLYPIFPENLAINGDIRHSTGFCFSEYCDKFKSAITGEENNFKDMSILQLYFILCGLTWRGEGYNVGYSPKTRTKKNKIGVSVANANIRNYVLDNLKIEDKRIWYIPYKKNIFKKMDEINKCKTIITDDLVTFHLSVFLRKYTYYLETFPLPIKLELFNNGEIYKVPMNLF